MPLEGSMSASAWVYPAMRASVPRASALWTSSCGGGFRRQNLEDRSRAPLSLVLNTAQRTGPNSPGGHQRSHRRQGSMQADTRRRNARGSAKPEEGQQQISAKRLHAKKGGIPLDIGRSKVIPLGLRK